jgi:UDP-3-O-[3-hydroxymyristoyl] glucosamine N-acyltransferase
MKFDRPIPVRELAVRYGATLIGDDTLLAYGINELRKVEPGDIAFSDVKKYFEKTLKSAATVLILNEAAECPPGKVLLVVSHPFAVYDDMVRTHRPFEPLQGGRIHPGAVIDPSAILEPGVVVCNQVEIGPRCYIQANVYLGSYTVLGAEVTIGPGSVIGSDAFYFHRREDGAMDKWCSGGRVILEDRVDIGAACTINKGVSGDTRIGVGSKLDCQVHIGHGVVIGKHCLIAAQTGIGGKSVLGDRVVLYGQVGVAQAVHIGDAAVVLAQSGVSKRLEGGKTYFGSPAEEVKVKYRELAALRLLPGWMGKGGS